MKVKKLENFQNKLGLKGYKWASLNTPGTETPVSYLFLGGSLILLFPIYPHGGGAARQKQTVFRADARR